MEIYVVNPLKVTLTLTDVMLLWSFLPTIASHDKPQAITNEYLISAKVSLYKPLPDKTNVSGFALSENSDQLGHPPHLIKVIAVDLHIQKIMIHECWP